MFGIIVLLIIIISLFIFASPIEAFNNTNMCPTGTTLVNGNCLQHKSYESLCLYPNYFTSDYGCIYPPIEQMLSYQYLCKNMMNNLWAGDECYDKTYYQ